jgi:hypothetical protein
MDGFLWLWNIATLEISAIFKSKRRMESLITKMPRKSSWM